MRGADLQLTRIAPSARASSAVAAISVAAIDRDQPMVALPRPEVQLVVRFGPATPAGLDVHAFGVRPTVRRKLIRAGQRTVTVRLHLGAAEAVLGVPAPALAGRIVALDDLWGPAAARRLYDRLAAAPALCDAAAIVDRAIGDRLAVSDDRRGAARLAIEAAARLATANVNAVAVDLGVSARHLRRVFRDATGVSPKAFARLARFHRALRAARDDRRASWASIATATGYYDQAHLIDEFRAITGATPRALLDEIGAQAARPRLSR